MSESVPVGLAKLLADFRQRAIERGFSAWTVYAESTPEVIDQIIPALSDDPDIQQAMRDGRWLLIDGERVPYRMSNRCPENDLYLFLQRPRKRPKMRRNGWERKRRVTAR